MTKTICLSPTFARRVTPAARQAIRKGLVALDENDSRRDDSRFVDLALPAHLLATAVACPNPIPRDL